MSGVKTPDEIRTLRREAEAGIRKAEGQLEVARARLRAIHLLCEHPYPLARKHYDGSASSVCPDCGFETTR